MDIYLIKGILEIIVLVILYLVTLDHDERITVLEEKADRPQPFIASDEEIKKLVKEVRVYKEPTFAQKKNTGYCTECNLETQPSMKCKCPQRQKNGSWNSKIKSETKRLKTVKK